MSVLLVSRKNRTLRRLSGVLSWLTRMFFRIAVQPTSVEFLVHMSLAAGVSSINSLADNNDGDASPNLEKHDNSNKNNVSLSRSEHVPRNSITIRHQRIDQTSVTGAQLDLQWRQLQHVEYLTDGGNSWIHTAVYDGKPVVVKTLKPECQDVVLAINEIEGELAVHSRLNHPNIVDLVGAGTTSRGVRFVVLERLDGGTLTQMLGYDTRIRDRRRRFWKKKQFPFLDVLRVARSIAQAMAYCHEHAIPGSVVLHRDLKPDNIGACSNSQPGKGLDLLCAGLRNESNFVCFHIPGFTLDGRVKILDFGLAKVVENASVDSEEVYTMSGETGSLRYMAPEVADALPYNYSADVYSFGIILWELNAFKKPFEGLNRDLFYERIVHGGERPPLNRKWPPDLTKLISECWDADMRNRPKFKDIVRRLDEMLEKEKGGAPGAKKQFLPKKLTGMIDRHSTWF